MRRPMDASGRITRARIQLMLDEPFWGTLLMHVAVVEDPGIPTMGTDGRTLRYNPAFVDTLSEQELEGVVAHEVAHCMLGHLWRVGHRNPTVWNVAADMSANTILKASGFTLPGDCLYPPEHLDDASTERLYEWCKREIDSECGGAEDGDGDEQDGSGGGSGGDCDLPESFGGGHVLDDHSGWSEADAEDGADWPGRITTAAQVARSYGKLPGGLSSLIEGLLTPRLDWRQLLAQWASTLTQDDYSRHRVREVPVVGARAYWPRLESEHLDVVVVDSSGSITDEQLAHFVSECAAILWSHDSCKLTILACDVEVQDVWEVTPDHPDLPRVFPGRGGTDFRPPFEWVASERRLEAPSGLVYLTDADGPFPETPPDYPVMWVVDGPVSARERVPWGITVEYDGGGS